MVTFGEANYNVLPCCLKITLERSTDPSHLWWVGATLIGALIGTLIPPEITGFEFALTAMFVTLAIDAVRHTVDNKLITYAVISSVFGVLMEYYVVNNAFLAAGLICYLSLISKDYIYSREEAIINDI
ncbi:hypothetical protein [Shewanella baltica]|uniref:hypothetical protein n=1 Tax=Shewanella baltica TaxID=62322 RepID=UPI00217D7231|nr:hypothetical protein [Shewanella baltica]